MPRTRKNHPPSLKAKVAVEAIKAHKTTAQIAQMFGVHPTQVGGWKKQALAGLPDVFGNGREQRRPDALDREEKDRLAVLDHVERDLELQDDAVGLLQERRGAIDVRRHQPVVGPLHHQDPVLPVRVHEDRRDPR